MSIPDHIPIVGENVGMDKSPDDVVGENTNNGFNWGNIWDNIGSAAGGVFDSALEQGSDWTESWLGNQLTTGSQGGGSNGQTNDSNASTGQGNQSMGLNITPQNMMIGGCVLVGVIVLLKVL